MKFEVKDLHMVLYDDLPADLNQRLRTSIRRMISQMDPSSDIINIVKLHFDERVPKDKVNRFIESFKYWMQDYTADRDIKNILFVPIGCAGLKDISFDVIKVEDTIEPTGESDLPEAKNDQADNLMRDKIYADICFDKLFGELREPITFHTAVMTIGHCGVQTLKDFGRVEEYLDATIKWIKPTDIIAGGIVNETD